MTLLHDIQSRFADALHGLTDDVASMRDLIRPSQDPRHGDFQANCAMPLSKALSRPSRDVATEIVSRLKIDDLCETPEVAGPGFINLRLRDEVLAGRVSAIAGDDRLGASPAASPHTVVVDFSSPNVAKPMHVGHLRSTVIGDAISRILRFAGQTVITDNHIGDWGTQFGMIILGFRNFVDREAYERDAVTELARLYRLVNQLADARSAERALPEARERLTTANAELQALEADPPPEDKKARRHLKSLQSRARQTAEEVRTLEARVRAVQDDDRLRQLAADHPNIAEDAREETARLHAGDPENRRLWKEFIPACLAALQSVYDRLEIRFDHTLGESFYDPMLPDVVREFTAADLASTSDGALCVFVPGNDAPFIIQKSDGAFTYATTDLATIRHRRETLQATELLYVVDSRQSEHFHLLFETARLAGWSDITFRHVSFGTVMGRDGRPFKTRAGDTVGLESLLDEAVARARDIVNDNDDRRESPQLSESERQRVAEIVGIGGIKYADLRHNRDSDYIFDWDKMLAKTGDTATYMQYAYARICGIFRRLNVDRDPDQLREWPVRLTTPEERALALQLLQFPLAIAAVLNEYRPHLLTAWLFSTAEQFSRFYDRCPVQNADSVELQRSRLVLCDLVARGLNTGLGLLGIRTADVM